MYLWVLLNYEAFELIELEIGDRPCWQLHDTFLAIVIDFPVPVEIEAS